MRVRHENAATVLVDTRALRELEVHLMTLDLRLCPVATSAVYTDGPRMAFQIRRRMITARRGEWDDATDWTPAWVCFGDSWYDGDEPLPWAAHEALWACLRAHADHVRYRTGIGGIPRVAVPQERAG